MNKFFVFSLIISTLFFGSCSKKIKLKAVKMTTGSIESTVTTINSGTIEAKEQATLAFGTVGRISKILVELGSIVQTGAIIAELENNDLKAISEEAHRDFLRAQELFNNGLVSKANLDSAKRAMEVAKTNLDKTIIRAPFKGMITALDLKKGEFYQSGKETISQKPIVQIIDLDKRFVKGEIDEIDLQKVKIGAMAKVKIPALKNQIFDAIITKVVPYISTAKDQDRTSQIELEIKNLDQKNLIPVGASADVEITVDKKENAQMIPTNSTFGLPKNKYVFIVDGNKLLKKEIKIGIFNYERTEILSGISKDDLIARPLDGIELNTELKVEAEITTWP